MARNISVLFPGQGSQYNGMGKDFYYSYPVVREIFDEVSKIVDFNIQNSIFEEDQQTLTYEQLFINILTLQYSSFHAFLDCYDRTPSYLLGHSLGEISALACSGALKLNDAIEIVRKRGQLMGSKVVPSGKMVAIMGCDMKILNDICEKISSENHDIVEIANWNSEEQVIISGGVEVVDLVLKTIETQKLGMSMKLNIKRPFHTKKMKVIQNDFYEFCRKFTYKKCSIPVISNVTGRPYEDFRLAEYLSEQLVNSVRWTQSVEFVAQAHSDLLVEMPPQTVLRNLLLTNKYGMETYSFDNKLDREELDDILVPISHYSKLSTEARFNFMSRCLVVAVATKNKIVISDEKYQLEEKEYKFIQQQLIYHEENELVPPNDLMRIILKSLIRILSIKGLNEKEIDHKIKELLIETGTFYYFNKIIRRRTDDRKRNEDI